MVEQNRDGIAKVHELIKGQRFAMVTTARSDSGALVSRPMACQDAEFDGSLWFLVGADSQQADDLRAHPAVNVAFTESGSWVSISGDAQVSHDPVRARELWNPFAKAWFQCEPEDAKVAVLRVEAHTAEYWDSPGKASQLLSVVKANLTGSTPDGGENETVRF